MAITRAVIPAAGLGTRLYPATKSQAKEMLPLGTRPVIHHVVEELLHAGITEILIVTGQKKRAIEDHFDAALRWVEFAQRKGVEAEVWEGGLSLFYTRQSDPLGLGDAVSRARAFCQQEPFVVALGDALIVQKEPGPSVVERLIATFEQYSAAACVATYQVPVEDTSRYGILAPAEPEAATGEQPFALQDLAEKPGPQAAPSLWAISARYVLSPAIFETLEAGRSRLAPGEELQLTDAIRSLVDGPGGVWAVPLKKTEFRLDVGNFVSYGQAFVRMLARDRKHGPAFREYLSRLVRYYEGRGPDPDCWADDGRDVSR